MKNPLTVCLFCHLAYADPVALCGLIVDSPVALQKTFDSAEAPKTALNAPVISSITHRGKNDDSTMEISVTRIGYADDHKLGLEREVRAQLNRFFRMPGVTNQKHALADAKISNLDAKRLSFRCDRMGKKVCIESVYVLRKQMLYIVQTAFIENETTLAQAEDLLGKVKLAAE